MGKIADKYGAVCENLGWSIRECEDGTVELESTSPAGEDLIVTVDAEDFVENVKAYAAVFDPDEHIEIWVFAKQNGASGVPSIRQLVKDADDIDEMLHDLAEGLRDHKTEMEADDEPLDDDAIEHCKVKPASLKKFVVKVTTVHTLEVEAENEDEATEKACGMAWEYDADSIDGEIVKEECA